MALFLHLSHLADSEHGPFCTAFPGQRAPEGQKATFWESVASLADTVLLSRNQPQPLRIRQLHILGGHSHARAVPRPARNAFIPRGRQLRGTKDFQRRVKKYLVSFRAASTIQQEVFSFSAGTVSGKGGVIPDLYRGEAGYSCSFECNYLQFLLFFASLHKLGRVLN